jgi:hypothetical protein
MRPDTSRALLTCLFVFLVFEWAMHLVGSRLSQSNYPRADRAAFAALSSAGIWIVLLAAFPMALERIGVDPVSPAGLAIMAGAACSALCVRLWFLREIYQLSLIRAAGLWALSRGAAVVTLTAAAVVWAASSAVDAARPLLRIGP